VTNECIEWRIYIGKFIYGYDGRRRTSIGHGGIQTQDSMLVIEFK